MCEGKYGGKDALIKFSQTYEATAHRLLTAHGLASALHQCLQLVGGGYMVIMERLAGEDAHEAFHGQNLPQSVTEDIQRALNLLHGSKRVFGDLRRPNIMVLKEEDEYRAKLVDLGCVGIDGQTQHSAFLNTDLRWPQGIVPCAPMHRKHDNNLLTAIIARGLMAGAGSKEMRHATVLGVLRHR
jgi:hypothetical protein